MFKIDHAYVVALIFNVTQQNKKYMGPAENTLDKIEYFVHK